MNFERVKSLNLQEQILSLNAPVAVEEPVAQPFNHTQRDLDYVHAGQGGIYALDKEDGFQAFLSKLKPMDAFIQEAKRWTPYDDVVFQKPRFDVNGRGELMVWDQDDSAMIRAINPETKAERQIATRLSLPSAMPDKLRSIGAVDEMASIFNKAASQKEMGASLLRSNDQGGFAFLTNAYKRLDNRIVLGPTMGLLNPDQWAVKDLHYKDPGFSRFYLIHKESARIVNGDRLMTALVATNAEDGSGKLTYALSILRLACLNGATVPMTHFAKTSMVHRGSRHSAGELAAMADVDSSILDLIPDEDGIFRQAETAVLKIQMASNHAVPYPQASMGYGLANWAGMLPRERDLFLQHKDGKYPGDNLWAWVNAMTELGHTENVKRNAGFEQLGWGLLEEGLYKDSFLQSIHHQGKDLLAKELQAAR